MAYDLTGHELLKGTSLTGKLLETHAQVAEHLLGLNGTSYTDEAGEVAKSAIAIQVKFQYNEGLDLTAFSMVSRGSRTWVPSAAARSGVSPMAKTLVDSITSPGNPDAGQTKGGFTVIRPIP